MQKLMIAVIGSASLLALPALAQTGSSASTAGSSTGSSAHSVMSGVGSSGNGSSNSNGASATTPMSATDMAQLRQKITSDLQQDGYKNVRVVANSFLVHAENKQGQPVVMIINPDSVFAVTQIGSANGAGGTGSPNGANHPGSGLGSSGTSSTGGNSGATTHQ